MGASSSDVYTMAKNFSSGEPQAWMEKMICLTTWQHFLLGKFSASKVSQANSNPRERNLASRELQLKTKNHK